MHRRASMGGLFPLFVSLLLPACGGEYVEEPVSAAESAITTADVAITGPNHVSGKVSLPSSLVMRTSASGCLNHPGPFITVEGELTIAGLASKVILKNNAKGTHVATALADADVELIANDGKIVIPKGGKYGVGGNPHIYLEVHDDYGKTYGDRIYLGRCNRLLPISKVDFSMLADLDFDVVKGDCENSGGPNIVLSGALKLGGVHGTLYFQNNTKGTKVATEEVKVAIEVLPKGKELKFAKSPHLGGAGGNPLVYLKLLDHDYNPISGEIFLGRCNKI
jgi:hypothetical protein